MTETDLALLGQAAALPAKSRAAMEDYSLHAILAEIWRVVAEANRYFAAEEPWIKRKVDPERMQTILYVTAEVLRIIAIMTQPFMPTSMARLLDLLNVAPNARGFDQAEAAKALAPGAPLPPPSPIFPRYVEPEDGGRA